MASENDTPSPAAQLVNAVKLVGDLAVLPGSSLLVEGKVPQGGAHAILGFLAGRLLGPVLGPVGWILVAANSYAKSTSGSYLHDYVLDLFSKGGEVEESPVATPTPPAPKKP
jgi:hypothetical protein